MTHPFTLGLTTVASLCAPIAAQVDWSPTYGGRVDHVMFYDQARSTTVLFGGRTGAMIHAGAWELADAPDSTWTQLDLIDGPEEVYGQALAYDTLRGEAVMFGGLISNGTPSKKTWIWRGGGVSGGGQPPDPPGRWGHAMAYDELRDKIVMFGGLGTGDVPLRDTWEWDGATWSRKSPANNPLARAGHTMAYHAMLQRVLLFGGNDGVRRNDLWAWDGTNWSLLQDGTGAQVPSPRDRSALARTESGTAILFGGESDQQLENDAWEWIGGSWVLLTPGREAPTARAGHSIAYMGTIKRRIVVAGGTGIDRRLSDVWQLRNSSWNLRAPGNTPPTRGEISISYDEIRDRAVLHSADHACPSAAETWEWDGSAWSRANSSFARRGAAAAFMLSAQSTVVTGGLSNTAGCSQPTAGVRSRAGGAWISLAPMPAPRHSHAMTYDRSRDRLVVFGGDDGNGPQNQTWESKGTGANLTWKVRSPSVDPPFSGTAYLTYHDARTRTVLLTRGATGPEHWEWDSDWSQVMSPSAVPFGPMAYDKVRDRLVVNADDGHIWEWDGLDWYQRIASVAEGRIAYDSLREKIVAVDQDGLLWYLGPSSPANYATFGLGCLGSGGIPTLNSAAPPWVGEPFSLTFADTPTHPGIVWIGFSDTAWNTLPLPFLMSGIGITGCTLYTGIEMSFPITGSQWSFTIPNRASLLGGVFYNQALFLDPGTNPFGAVVTNAGRATIGGK